MTVSEKIKTTDNKSEQNEAQYDLDRKMAKVSALSSGHVDKYKLLTRKYVLLEKDLLEKSCCNQKIWIFTIKWCVEKKNLPLQKKQHKILDKFVDVIKNSDWKTWQFKSGLQIFDFNKLNISDEEFDELFNDTRYNHHKKSFQQNKWIQKGKM